MRKQWAIGLAIAALVAAQPALAGNIDESLKSIMNAAPAGEIISTLVFLNEQVDIDLLTARLDIEHATLRRRHEVIVRALQQVAADTQGAFLDDMRALETAGQIERLHVYWISNVFRIDVRVESVAKIAAHPSVKTVYFNYEIELIEPVESSPGGIGAAVTDSLREIRAPEAWALGYDGSGVLVSNMDTGVDGTHPALADRWAGVADPRYAGHPEWAWFDPFGGQNDFPRDSNGHGTHTMGTICGGAPGREIGVAPGATWMGSAPIDRGGGIPRTVADALLSFEWMLDPDGDPSTNWDVPAVNSNSWGVTTGHGFPPCDETFWSHLDACEAAGIVILFSAGNEGTSGLRRPADRATDEYRTCAVAAVDCEAFFFPWPIASFSSRGPTNCTPGGESAIKPDISAPGVNVDSAAIGGGYRRLSGTSMASPHVNGVVALIRQACPDLTVPEVKQVLYDSAVDLGDPGEDNTFGWGNINAEAAVLLALELCIDSEGQIDLDSAKYACEDQVNVIVRDLDLNLDPNTVEVVDITIESDSEPAGEIITLTETGPDTSRFEALVPISETNAVGTLQVADGDTIVATYNDDDNGQGQPAVVTAEATVDCAPPQITNVRVIDVQARSATIAFDSNEPAFGIAAYGLDCNSLNSSASGRGFTTTPTVDITGLQDNTTYFFTMEAEDEAGNRGADPVCYSFTTPEVPDFFTEQFASGFDLEGLSVSFIPDGGPDFYVGCDEDLAGLPTDPTGGTALPLTDDSFAQVTPPQSVSLYGTSYNSFFVGSNGYITFGAGDRDFSESLVDHFRIPRISGAFDDLNPGAGGTVSWKDAGDRVAVTWEDVPEFSNTGANTFQIEIFYADGTIRMSYLSMTLQDCIAGLSDGSGLDPDFFPSDLSNMGSCGPRPPRASGSNAEVPVNTPTAIELMAVDDGLPDPPAALTYIVVSLPAEGDLRDLGNGHDIVPGDLPYTLSGGGNQVRYSPDANYFGNDDFRFKANDGGVPPDGGDSNIAEVSILVLFGPPQITTESLPDGCIDQPYGQVQLEADGGQPELTWSVVAEGEYTEWNLGTSLFANVGSPQGWNADDGSWPYTLPFPFPFYGQDYNNLWITSNGVIDFADVFADWTNSDAELIANRRITALWDDLRTDRGGDIFIREQPGVVRIRWETVTFGGGNPVNLAVDLFADGRIRFHYGGGNNPITPTIGISNGDGSNFLLSTYNNAPSLTNADSLEQAPLLPLPAGMEVSPDGVLSGTPTEFGEFLPRFRVVDSLGRIADAEVPLTITEECECVPCDMNCDGNVDAGDIEFFIDLLFNNAVPCCGVRGVPGSAGDVNGDGNIDNNDIEGFIGCLFP